MESDQPPQSPFAPRFEGSFGPEAEAPSPPDPYQGGEPRLGILHLLVWTACVAMVLGVDQSFYSKFAAGDVANRVSLTSAVQSPAAGAALAGLLLWGRRRYRGQAFPRYPGEYLLVAIGVIVATYLGIKACASLIAQADAPERVAYWSVSRPWTCAQSLVTVIAYLVLAIRMKATRWRVAFISCVSVAVLRRLGLPFYPFIGLAASYLALTLIRDVFVAIAILRDWRQGLRYPWTHWAGIAVLFWGTVTQLTWMSLR